MSDHIDWQTIDRYLAGQVSAAERDAVESWMRSSPANQMLVDASRRAADSGTSLAWDVDAAWARVQGRLGTPTVRRVDRASSSPIRTISPLRRRWLIAAALLVVVGPFAAWRLRTRGMTSASVAMREALSPSGKRTTIDLADGSRVTLNSGSRFRYPADLTRARDVELDGEGYFVVTHDEARPFRVHARGAVVQDIGTRFTVRAYAEHPQVEVIVSEGVVSMRHDSSAAGDSTIVRAGQRGRFMDAGRVAVEPVSTERYTSWAQGALILENVTLGDARRDLERWYDIEISLADSALAGRQLMARFHDESASAALNAIGIALDVQVEQRGRTFTLKRRP